MTHTRSSGLPCGVKGCRSFNAIHRVHDAEDVGLASCYSCDRCLQKAKAWVVECGSDHFAVSPLPSRTKETA